MIFSGEISYFLLLFGLVALVHVHDVNGDIDIDEIDRQLSNPCVPNARRRRDVSRETLEMLNSTSKMVFLEFKEENPGYCRFADIYTDLADIGVKEALPVRTSSSQLCDDLKFYYAWMLWIKEAKQFMDMVDVPSFSVTLFNEMVNLLRQAVCECPLGASTPLFPDSTTSTDPVDYLEPTCYVLEKFSQFSTSAYVCTRKGRKGDPKQKTTTDQPEKSTSPPTGKAGGKGVKREDGNKEKGQDRKENRRTRNRQVEQNMLESTRTDNSKWLPEESNPGNDIHRGDGQKRKGHGRKPHGRKKNGRKKNKLARISNLDVNNPTEATESKQINKSDNTPPCATKPETTKPERRQRMKGKGNRRKGRGGKRRGKKNRKGKRGKRNRKNRRRNKQRKNKNKNKDRRNKRKKDRKEVGRRLFPERKRKETKPILDFFFF